MSEKPPETMTIKPYAPPPPATTTITVETPVEALKNKKAFEHYYSLGDDRNLTKVSQKFNMSPATITKWSSKFDWGERVITRDKSIGDRLKYETDEETTATRRDILRVIRTLVGNMVVEDENGKVSVTGIGLKNIAEMREAYELTERILNPNASDGEGGDGAKQQIQVNIMK